MIIEDSLEEIFKPQLQKHLEFELNNKTYKRGKLILYKIETYSNNYELTLMFEKHLPDGTIGTETFKIPYPFKFEIYTEDNETVIFFDYRLYTLANNNVKIQNKLAELSKKYKKSKYYDSILKIKCIIK